jgi:pimeloyl-ACP methyl ester carboxylesterase
MKAQVSKATRKRGDASRAAVIRPWLRFKRATLRQCESSILPTYMPSSTSASESSSSAHNAPAPSFALLAMEFRAFWEFGAVFPAWPALQRAPQGDGHSVIIFPGLAASDTSTVPLRKYLQTLGYEVVGWQQGSNFGPRAGVLETAKRHVLDASQDSGRKVSLVGWSLGGIYAREIAKELPEHTRCVITLGTPFAGGPRSTNAWRLYEAVSGRDIDRETDHYALHEAPSSPTTSIYSKSDGIVAWQGSIQHPAPHNPHTENIQVLASHFGIGLNPSAWWAVADRLAQSEGYWQPFQKPRLLGMGGLVFPTSKRSA